MNKGGTMYRLTGFEKQERELLGAMATEEKRRAARSLIKTLRQWTRQQFAERSEGHAYYGRVLTMVKQALLLHTHPGDRSSQAAV